MVVTTGCRHQPAVRQRHEVELVAHHVELARPLERGRVVQALVHLGVDAGILLVATRGLCVQPGRRQGVGGGEQRDVVAEGDQALGEGRRDLLPRPVTARRSAVGDRGEHADAQRCSGPSASDVRESLDTSDPTRLGPDSGSPIRRAPVTPMDSSDPGWDSESR